MSVYALSIDSNLIKSIGVCKHFQMNKLYQCTKGFVTAGITLIFLMCLPFSSSVLMMQYSDKYIYTTQDELPEKDVALVLGAAAYPSRLSDILQDRVDTAIELYKAKKVNKLIMSGAKNEAESMAKYALENGVAEKDIIKDPKGLSTIESIRNAKDFDEMIIVTQSFHLPRSIYLARHLGIDAVGMVSDKRTYEKIFDFSKREILASSKAMMDLLLK